MGFDAIRPISLLQGGSLLAVTAREHDWSFEFDNGVAVSAEGHWRLIAGQRVLVTDEDHGQLFGLTEPVDAARIVRDQLIGSSVEGVSFSACSDLLLQFTNGQALAVLVNSAGYENWHVRAPDGSHTVAIGGGELCRIGATTE